MTHPADTATHLLPAEKPTAAQILPHVLLEEIARIRNALVATKLFLEDGGNWEAQHDAAVGVRKTIHALRDLERLAREAVR